MVFKMVGNYCFGRFRHHLPPDFAVAEMQDSRLKAERVLRATACSALKNYALRRLVGYHVDSDSDRISETLCSVTNWLCSSLLWAQSSPSFDPFEVASQPFAELLFSKQSKGAAEFMTQKEKVISKDKGGTRLTRNCRAPQDSPGYLTPGGAPEMLTVNPTRAIDCAANYVNVKRLATHQNLRIPSEKTRIFTHWRTGMEEQIFRNTHGKTYTGPYADHHAPHPVGHDALNFAADGQLAITSRRGSGS
ncbi:hypothetical protein BU15DRAFT_66135 [Melanogaster broomeanus]|nr:hypothetical protein BU15DRAFT_66135 [Melanogaster broomeanus]